MAEGSGSGVRRRQGKVGTDGDVAGKPEAAPEPANGAESDTPGVVQVWGGGGFSAAIYFLCFLWYTQLFCALGLLGMMVGATVPHSILCEHFLLILGTTFMTSPNAHKVMDDTKEPVVFLCNHRSWADFFLDGAQLGGTSFVSRWMVAIAIPVTAIWGWIHGWLWFFNRGKKRAEGTVAWMTGFYRRSHVEFPGKGVVMYPEGTRTQSPEGNPLKPGGLAVAHALGWPVQSVITTNKEHIMAEGRMQLGRTCCTTSVSEPIWPQHYKTVDEFTAEVTKRWRATWEDAHKCKGVPRGRALLPGAVAQTGMAAFPGSSSMNMARSCCVFSLLIWAHLRQQQQEGA